MTSAYFLVPRHCTLCSCRPIDRKKTCVFCCCSLWSAATLFGTRLRRWCGCRTTQPPCLHACENLQQSGKRPRTLPCGARSNFHACRSIFSVTSSSQKSKCEHNKRSRGREVEREREGRAGEGGERDYSDITSLLPPPISLPPPHPSSVPPSTPSLPLARRPLRCCLGLCCSAQHTTTIPCRLPMASTRTRRRRGHVRPSGPPAVPTERMAMRTVMQRSRLSPTRFSHSSPASTQTSTQSPQQTTSSDKSRPGTPFLSSTLCPMHLDAKRLMLALPCCCCCCFSCCFSCCCCCCCFARTRVCFCASVS